jgi:hypothetical protein
MCARRACLARCRRSSAGSMPSGSTSRSNRSRNALRPALVRELRFAVRLQEISAAILLSMSFSAIAFTSSRGASGICLGLDGDPLPASPRWLSGYAACLLLVSSHDANAAQRVQTRARRETRQTRWLSLSVTSPWVTLVLAWRLLGPSRPPRAAYGLHHQARLCLSP